jgi:hypothetical protein
VQLPVFRRNDEPPLKLLHRAVALPEMGGSGQLGAVGVALQVRVVAFPNHNIVNVAPLLRTDALPFVLTALTYHV